MPAGRAGDARRSVIQPTSVGTPLGLIALARRAPTARTGTGGAPACLSRVRRGRRAAAVLKAHRRARNRSARSRSSRSAPITASHNAVSSLLLHRQQGGARRHRRPQCPPLAVASRLTASCSLEGREGITSLRGFLRHTPDAHRVSRRPSTCRTLRRLSRVAATRTVVGCGDAPRAHRLQARGCADRATTPVMSYAMSPARGPSATSGRTMERKP